MADGGLALRARARIVASFAAAVAALHLSACAAMPDPAAAAPVLDPNAEAATRGGDVFIIGDSTASYYPPENYPRMGWGMVIGCYLARSVRVYDFAVSGRSSKSYIAEEYWARLEQAIGAGDTVLIQLGANDEKITAPHLYTDAATTFPDNLRRFVAGVRARGATPVLITPVARRIFVEARLIDTHGPWAAAVKTVAAETGAALIDLNGASLALFERLGPEASKAYFLHFSPGQVPAYPDGATDDSHFSELGARAVAGIIAEALAGLDVPAAQAVRLPPPEEALRVRGGPFCGRVEA